MTAATIHHAARYYDMGLSFLRRARKMVLHHEDPVPFLLYSIIIRSIENLCMFLCTNRGFLPGHERMADFIEALDSCGLINEEIRLGLIEIEDLYGSSHSTDPGPELIMNSIYTAERILSIADVEKRGSVLSAC